MPASPCEAKSSGEANLASPTTKKKAFKAKHMAFQPMRANFQSPRVPMLDQLGPTNTDLRDYLRNKPKHHSEKPVFISPSKCRQVGCQLVAVYSVTVIWGQFPWHFLQTNNQFLIDYLSNFLRYPRFKRRKLWRSKTQTSLPISQKEKQSRQF